MFARLIDDFKASTATTLRLTSLAAAMAVASFVTLSFLCAAAFVFVFERYGLVLACLTGAGVFFAVALIAAAIYKVRKDRIEVRAKETAKSALHSAFADPMLVATGIQLVRAIGIRKLIPILAVGGLALGLLASRTTQGSETPAE